MDLNLEKLIKTGVSIIESNNNNISIDIMCIVINLCQKIRPLIRGSYLFSTLFLISKQFYLSR